MRRWIEEKHSHSKEKRMQRRSKAPNMEGVQIDRAGSQSRSQGLLS